jgi:hypothetical protein
MEACAESMESSSGETIFPPLAHPPRDPCSSVLFRRKGRKAPPYWTKVQYTGARASVYVHHEKEIMYVKVINNLGADRRTGRGGVHEPGPISRQQTTDSDTSCRDPRAIRNELSKRNRAGAFARGDTARSPGTDSAGRRTRTIYDRRCGLRPAAGLSGFLSDGWRQLHGAGRSDLVSETCEMVSGFGCCYRTVVSDGPGSGRCLC